MRAMLMICLLSVTALAGCTSDGDTDAGVDGGVDSQDLDDATESLPRFQVNTSVVDPIVIESSGSFMPHEAFVIPQAGLEDDIYRISDEVPEVTAVRMEAVLSYEDTAVGVTPGPFYMFFDWSGALVRDLSDIQYQEDGELDTQTLTATLLPPSDDAFAELIVGMNADGWFGAPPQSYDLKVTLTPVTASIPQYAAASVTVPEGGRLLVESLSGAGRVMLFDGDDEAVGVFNVKGPTVVVDAAPARAEYVIVTMDDIWAKAFVEQEADLPVPELRHVPVAVETKELGTVDSGGPMTFTFDADTAPLQAGFRFGSPSCLPGECYRAEGWSATLIDPDGNQTLSESSNCFLCGGFQTYVTSWDDGMRPSGEYTLEWDSSESMNVEIQSVHVTHKR